MKEIKRFLLMPFPWGVAACLAFLKNVSFSSLGAFSVPEGFQVGLFGGLFLLSGYVLPGFCGYWIDVLFCPSLPPAMKGVQRDIRKFGWISVLFLLFPFLVQFLFFLGGDLYQTDFLMVFVAPLLGYFLAHVLVKDRGRSFDPAKKVFEDLSVIELLLFSSGSIVFLFSFFLAAGTLSRVSWLAGVIDVLRIYCYFFVFFAAALLLYRRNFEETARASGPSPALIMINPSFSGIIPAVSSLFFRHYPGIFLVLRALTPARYRIVDYNRHLWEDRFFEEKGIVAITCFSSNSPEAYRIAKEYRRRGNTVIMGGPHVTFFPDEALEFCDAVVVGEVEGVWEEIISDYENGCLRRVYQGSCPPEKVRRVVEFMKEVPANMLFGSLEATRGCKFRCHFCTSPALLKGRSLRATVEDIVEILTQARRERDSFYFVDNNIYLDPSYAKDLFRALIPLKIKWGSSISIDVARDDEAVSLLRLSGCDLVGIGYEITRSSGEKARGGKFSFAQEYLELTAKLRKAGVNVKANFMFGFLGDTWPHIFDLWSFAFRLGVPATILSFLTPLPGSEFFNDMVREERILNLNWRSYNAQNMVFHHPRLGHPLLLRKGFWMFSTLFSLTTSGFFRVGLVSLFLLVAFRLFYGV
ncbi:MAG: radical SAM protein [Elusimicrobia bacterium]|nr:radical SAM protein [Elusimicrobiota bacterium]